jgi:hypothetical protein
MRQDAHSDLLRHLGRRFPHRPSAAGAVVVLFFSVAAASCMRPSQMCMADSECHVLSSCVAGRCIGHGAVPAIAAARRIVYAPVDVGYLRHGDKSGERVTIAPLGSRDGGLLLLRFAIDLAPDATVLEAYVLLERATEVDDDPTPVALHVARIVEPWESASISWARQPRIDNLGAPVTRVRAGSGPIVRVDVRTIVQRWRRRSNDEFGLAVLTDGESATGISVALAPSFDAEPPGSRLDPVLADFDGESSGAVEGPTASPGRTRSDPTLRRGVASTGPELELYVK